MSRWLGCLAVALIIAAAGNALGQPRARAAHGCSTSECFDQFVLATTIDGTGIITAEVKTEFSDNPGASPRTTRTLLARRSWKTENYKASCKKPDGYIERPNGEKIHQPEVDPPQRTQADKELWLFICSMPLPPKSQGEHQTADSPMPKREGGGSAGPASTKTETVQFSGVITKIVDAADFVINGQQLRLIGIDPGPADALPPFERWLRSHAELKCELSERRQRYRCVTTNGLDVAEAALLNGAGPTSDDAAPIYRQREAEARQNRRGMWANSNR